MSEKIANLKDIVKRFRKIEKETEERQPEIARYERFIDQYDREDGIELKAKDKKTAIESETETIDETVLEKWIVDVEAAMGIKKETEKL
jgi:phage regulator Rha-like protein